jgi:anthranilate/para-aminobenzoate synthase component II
MLCCAQATHYEQGIHFGSCNHRVLVGDYHESIVISKALVKLEVEQNPKVTTSTIIMATSKIISEPRVVQFH